MSTKLILIRHGVTNWNQEKRYSGFKDIGLNTAGKNQARRLCKRLKKEKISKVYSSDKKRAIQTAKLIFKGSKVEIVPVLKELHFGCLEGLTYNEIMKKYPKFYKKWLDDPFSVEIPKGESLNNFKKRVLGAFRKIVCLNRNKTIAVVCHGGAISVFINSILKSKGFWKHIPGSASVTIVEYKNNSPKINLFNDTAHLN